MVDDVLKESGLVGKVIVNTGDELLIHLQTIVNKPVGKSYKGDLFRSVPIKSENIHGIKPRIVTDSEIYSSWGRYDLNGAENAMYFSKTLNGNMTELVPHYGEWANYSTYQFQNVEFNNLLDLTDNAVRNQLRINFDQITTITPSKVEMYEIPNNIAKWAREQGYNGIIAPGARGSKNYENIIIFEQSYIDKTLNTPIRIK